MTNTLNDDNELQTQLEDVVDKLINWATDFMAGDDVNHYTHIVNPAIGTRPRTQTIEVLMDLIHQRDEARYREERDKWKSICGCPMCEHHSTAYRANPKKGNSNE